ncbi:GL10968 [Drosophila persimilis]|uniref:GL10968 n=1 Tax=Drosophila persimilis TaxID=7234 RepID=B4GCA4_DROPE|nr:GL10968 [Drosophila persimilis]
MDGSGDNQLSMQLTRDVEARRRMIMHAEREHQAIAAMAAAAYLPGHLQLPRAPAQLPLPRAGLQPDPLQNDLDEDSGFESGSESD